MKPANRTPTPGPANIRSDISRQTYFSKSEDLYETYVVIPPDSAYGWLVVLASFLCQLLTDGSIYTFGIFLKDIAYSLKCPESRITLSSSIQNGCYNLSGPVTCALINRFGFRRVCISGAILTSIAYAGTSFVQSLPMLIFVHGILAGLGFSLIYMPSIIIVGFYFEKWRLLATSIIVSGAAIGTVIFPPFFNILLKEYNWRNKFRIISGFALFMIICGVIYRPVKQTRIVQQTPRITNRMGLQSIASTMTSTLAVKQIFSRHNLSFPTTATIVRQGDFSLYDPSPSSSEILLTSSIDDSMKTNKTDSYLSRMPTEEDQLQTIIEDPEGLTKCQICCMKCKRNCANSQCCRRKRNIPFRPMYRDDVFLVQSSLAPSQFSAKSRERKLDYHLSMTRVTTQRDFKEEYIPCLCCPESVRRTLATMFDCSMIRSPPFLMLLISAFLSTLGIYIPYLYIIDANRVEGEMHAQTAVLLMTVLGASNAIGRLGCGLLNFFPNIKPMVVSVWSLLIAGTVTAFFTLSYNVIWQFTYASIYGLSLAFSAATRPLIIVELVGLENLTNAFGLQAVFQGLACLTGIPIAGLLLEITNKYAFPFCFAAFSVIISSLLLLVVRFLNIREKRRLS